MFKKFLITGATGFLGSALLTRLQKEECTIRVLVLENDPLEKNLPQDIEIIHGSVSDPEAVKEFLSCDLKNACLIHCAGIISIATKKDKRLGEINVKGTKVLLDECLRRNIPRVVHVSSVHAIPEKEKGQEIAECDHFSPDDVVGQYAKSKAEATEYALQLAKQGLNLSVVHPSGIIGPNDEQIGSMTGVMISYCQGKLRYSAPGGYDFVDVRDVAEGILSCAELGKVAKCYILSNTYASIHDILTTLKKLTHGPKLRFCIPKWVIKMAAPICEKYSLRKKEPLFLTPYSAYTLQSNGRFSHERAENELNYHPRPLKETLKDVVTWMKKEGKV